MQRPNGCEIYKNELNALEKQGKVKISVAMIKKHPGKMPN